MENQGNEINFEKVLAEYNSDNRMSAHAMIKRLSETAPWEEKVNFAEYILFVGLTEPPLASNVTVGLCPH